MMMCEVKGRIRSLQERIIPVNLHRIKVQLQKIIEVEIVLLRTLEVKRNVGRGTPTFNFGDNVIIKMRVETMCVSALIFYWKMV